MIAILNAKAYIIMEGNLNITQNNIKTQPKILKAFLFTENQQS